MQTTGSITFRGAELVLPDRVAEGDLAIEDGRIVAIGRVERAIGEEIDARGLTLMPGVIDPQVHFREPGPVHKEDLETGSKAAAAGGVTAFLEMPNTNPPTTTPAALQDKFDRAAGRCRSHYGFFYGATPDNAGTVPDPTGVPGIKVFMGSSTGTLLVDDQDALEAQFAGASVPIVVHAEDETRLRARKAQFAGATDPAMHPVIRDVECALIATKRAVDLARRHGKRLHVLHLSTAEETDFLRGLPPEGLITTETLPQYLWLDASHYARLGTRLQMNPPVRDARHGEALWAGLLDGTIACIATDHAPHTLDEKALGFGKAPSGMPGVELSLPLMLHAVAEGRCSIRHVVRWMCEAPAHIYGIVGKGRLVVGGDGDVTLVDRKAQRTVRADDLHTRAGWSPFEGWTLTGWPTMTVLGGRPVYRDGAHVDGVFGSPLRFAHHPKLPPLPALSATAAQ